jgi:hypothetical protein
MRCTEPEIPTSVLRQREHGFAGANGFEMPILVSHETVAGADPEATVMTCRERKYSGATNPH